MPVAQLQKGMMATGYTVVEGREPTSFGAEILGVLQDGIAPGRDMIIVETSGPALDRAEGIWFGMSGSPIYFDHKLIGAVAFGLSFGPSKVAGVTPAEDMLEILGYPEADQPTASRSGTSGSYSQQRVPLTARMRETIARATGAQTEDVGSSMEQLKVPVAISGVTGRAMKAVREVVAKEDLPIVPYTGSSASSATPAEGATLKPGGNFAAAASYGDISLAGVGTTTYVCDGQVLAFGHPFLFTGSTTLGANDADALVIVDDPFGPYKLATIEEGGGTVDQDRLAGIRTIIGGLPQTIPITSVVSALDTGKTRAGETDSVTSELTPTLSFLHLLYNIDSVFDQIGQGSSELSWTITGTKEDGTPWSLTRSNRYASEFDIAFESIFEQEIQMFTLFNNPFEEIEFTGVDMDVTLEEDVKAYQITGVLVSKNGTDYLDVRRVRVRPGRTIYLRVELTPHDDTGPVTADLEVVVPETARSDGYIEITSGSGSYEELFCFLEGSDCVDEFGEKIDTFDKLLTYLANRPRNNELLARLRMGGRGRVKSRDAEVLSQVVSGFENVRVRLIGRGGGTVVSEPKPAD